MAKILRLFDRLQNAVTGTGTSRDPRTASTYALARQLTDVEIAAAYSGSGLIRKICNIPAHDMVREWRDWTADTDHTTAIEAEEKRLDLRGKIRTAELYRALGGGAIILGVPGDPWQPVPPNPGKDGLAYLNVVSRWHLTFQTLQENAALPGYGEPVMWRMNTAQGQVEIHPSRVIPFRGAPLAPMMHNNSMENAFWGESIVAQVLNEVKDSDTARASFAGLMHKARVLRIGIPNLMELVSGTDGETLVMERLAVLAQAESIHNAVIFDAGDGGSNPGETITDATYSFAGAKDILNAYAEFVCAVADIPATRLLGRAPEGMNSSGDSQQKDWAKKIRAKQTLELQGCLDRIDAWLVPSALGSYPPEILWEFAPLDMPSQAEEATRFKATAEALEKVQAMACIPDIAFANAAQNTLVEGGWMPGLEAALAAVPEAERYGIEPDMDDPDPNAEGGDLNAGADDPNSRIGDAAPRTLYVQRKLLNAAEFVAWAKAQGFETTVPANELHVTVAFSRSPVDWMAVEPSWDGDKGDLIVPPGGARLVEPLGDKGAVVLLFASSSLAYRHEAIKRAGASWDYPEYQPHVTITYAGTGVDLSKVEPFRGALHFGPEIFEELNEDWASGITEA